MVSLMSENQVDAEILLAMIQDAGYELTNEAGLADVAIVNTCGFIESAKQESIEKHIGFCQLKQEDKIKCVVVTGCLAERYRDEVAKEIPEADVILGLGSNKNSICNQKGFCRGNVLLAIAKKNKLPMEGRRCLTTLPYYAI